MQFAERYVLSIKSECLNHFVILGETMLQRIIENFNCHYEDDYIAWLWVWEGRQSWFELAFSRDGIQWQRILPGRMAFPLGEPGSWDSEMVSLMAPVVYDDKIRIYYGGWNHPYTSEAMKRVEEGWIENGQRRQRAIGLATLRLDGFVSLAAGEERGIVTTKPLHLPGGSLFVNADVQGELRAEILDARSQTLPGFSLNDCVPIRSDGLRHEIQWQSDSHLDTLEGRIARVRFELVKGELYAFWFVSGSMQ